MAGAANIMVIAVLERRSEIGLRRALGATRGHIRTQFLTEAILLALIGKQLVPPPSSRPPRLVNGRPARLACSPGSRG